MATPPVFVKVAQLCPGTTGHTLLAMVLTSKTVRRKGRAAPAARQTRIECLIGDDTGCILFIAPSSQGEMLKLGNTIILRDANVDMSKGTMKLVLDKKGPC